MTAEKMIPLPNGFKAYADSQPESCGLNEIFRVKTYSKFYPLREGMRVLDAGACVGMFTLKAAKIVGEKGLVVAVEPHAEAFHWLLRNVKLNGCENVVCVNAALWNQVGVAKLSVGWLGATSLVRNHHHMSAYVGTVTIDYLKGCLGFKRLDFLKVDTEGAEWQILRDYVLDQNVYVALEAHDNEGRLKPLLEEKGLRVRVELHSGASSMIYATNRDDVDF